MAEFSVFIVFLLLYLSRGADSNAKIRRLTLTFGDNLFYFHND